MILVRKVRLVLKARKALKASKAFKVSKDRRAFKALQAQQVTLSPSPKYFLLLTRWVKIKP